MALTEIKIAINKLNSAHADYSANVSGLAVQAVTSGATLNYDGNGNVIYKIHSNNLPMATAKTVVALGLEVKNYPFFIEMTPTDSVPSGVPNRLNSDSTVKTWNDWKLSNFDIHTATDGTKYVAGEASVGDVVVFNDYSSVFDDCIDAETFSAAMPSGE